MNMGYPQGGPGAPSTKPLPAAIPPPPTGKYCLPVWLVCPGQAQLGFTVHNGHGSSEV